MVPRTKNELLVHACPRSGRGAAEPLETGYGLAAKEIVIAHDVLGREVQILHSRCCMLATPEAVEAGMGNDAAKPRHRPSNRRIQIGEWQTQIQQSQICRCPFS